MGEIAVLRPQNCLRGGHHHKNNPQFDPKQRRNPNFSTPKPKSNPRSRRFSGDSARKGEIPAAKNNNNLVMGRVKILKRGEAIEDVIATATEEIEKSDLIEKTKVIDLTPKVKEMVGGVDLTPKVKESVGVVDLTPKVKGLEELMLSTTDRLGPEPEMVPRFADLYAGYAFVDSPPPSCLPLPGFFKRDADATSDIRRILRLDLG